LRHQPPKPYHSYTKHTLWYSCGAGELLDAADG
jgi:hypothetical protein